MFRVVTHHKNDRLGHRCINSIFRYKMAQQTTDNYGSTVTMIEPQSTTLPWYAKGNLYQSIDWTEKDASCPFTDGPTYTIPPHFDADAFMRTANYWMVDDGDLPADALMGLLHAANSSEFRERVDKEYMRPELASFLGCAVESQNELCYICSEYGYSNFLERAIADGYDVDEKAIHIAAYNGYVNCMEILGTIDMPDPVESSLICEVAAANGHTECLQIAHELGYAWDGACAAAAFNGNMDCIKFMYAHGYNSMSFMEKIYVNDAYTGAAIMGHLNCLRYMHEHDSVDGRGWSTNTTRRAAEHGQLDCLRYAHEHGCPWDIRTCSLAARNGNIKCLQYAHEQGCPWDSSTCDIAAEFGHLNCIIYAHEHGCTWESNTCTMAALTGNIECLRYAHEHGCPWTEFTCLRVIEQNQITCLQYITEHGCPFPEHTIYTAIRYGHIECMQYLHEIGQPWNATTCAHAAGHGHLKCLQYAHEHECPWDERTILRAKTHHHKDCLEYALANGCGEIVNTSDNEKNDGDSDYSDEEEEYKDDYTDNTHTCDEYTKYLNLTNQRKEDALHEYWWTESDWY